jgi:competence protein ComFC
MRCLSCTKFSFFALCKKCQKNLLKPSFFQRELKKDFFVYSFYGIDEVKEFINTKYHFYGDRVYTILANLAFTKFASNFEYPNTIIAIPIDDHTRHQFSQTAILAKALQSQYVQPVYNTLKASNQVKYAGKDLAFRKANKRDFVYSGKSNLQVILIDDVVTTGSTILEAKEILEQSGCEVLFALTLSDAKGS